VRGRRRLAEKFGTTAVFVGMVVEASKERKAKMAKKVQRVKDGWGLR
jgi:hypothetical protein